MRSMTRPLAVIVFAVLSLLPLASIVGNWLWPWPHPDSMPRVSVVPLPDRVSLDVLNEFEQWFVDRIRRHLPLLAVNAAYRIGLLRRSTESRVVIGRDGWLFWTDEGDAPASMANFRGRLRFSGDEMRSFDRNLIAMHDELAACGIHALVAIAPNKQSIYGEFLSRSQPQPQSALDDLLPRLDPRARAVMLDLRAPLRAVKARDPGLPLYYKTDSHWNGLGAFYAYRAIMAALAKAMPDANLQIASLDQFAIKVEPFRRGDLAYMLSAPSWFADTAVRLYPKIETASSPDAPRLLMTGDSFLDELTAYFLPDFSKIYFEKWGLEPIAPVAGEAKPSAVVIEVAERYLPGLVTLSVDWSRFCTH